MKIMEIAVLVGEETDTNVAEKGLQFNKILRFYGGQLPSDAAIFEAFNVMASTLAASSIEGEYSKRVQEVSETSDKQPVRKKPGRKARVNELGHPRPRKVKRRRKVNA